MRPRPPPVTLLATAFLAGCVGATVLASPLAPLPSLLPLALLVLPFLRPTTAGRIPVAMSVAIVSGATLTHARLRTAEGDCRLRLTEGQEGVVAGWFETVPGPGLGPFRLSDGLGCRGDIRVTWSPPDAEPAAFRPVAGQAIVARGRWRRSARPDPARPHLAGVLTLSHVRAAHGARGRGLLFAERARARVRGRLEGRIRQLFPDTWPVASALFLARTEGLDPELREAFALAGISHLLAISGFHVGVVALLLIAGARGLGVRPKLAPIIATGGTWLYVGLIGFPDAACRAVLILTLVSLARLRSRPAGALGAVSSALLILLVVDPSALSRPGFQLSFAGAVGLVVGAPPLRAVLGSGWLGRVPRSLRDGVAAGVAATVFTLPFVAWHFGRVPLAGIGTTLLATPLVAAAIPGLLATLMASSGSAAVAGFVAGGTDVLLRLLERLAQGVGSLPGVSVWVADATLLGCLGGGLLGVAWTRAMRHRPRPWIRRVIVGLAVTGGGAAAPLAERALGFGVLEVVFLSVGQGDAVAVRSPAGRWVLVDAGPRGRSWDAGERVVLPYLHRRGVARLEALILTHPDLDHIGGARAVARDLHPRIIMDPGRAAGKDAYVDVLEVAAAQGIPWLEARAGSVLDLDGARLEVLHPDGPATAPPGKSDSNAESVVLLVRYGSFEALLTGDAPTEVEDAILEDVPRALEVLKVGHHGSLTSTSPGLLSTASPELAVISVGSGNRYGHPHAAVLRRLREAGVRVLRTDRSGHVRVRARRGGRWVAEVE